MEFRDSSRADGLILREAGSGQTVWYFHDEVSAQPGPAVAQLAEHFHVLAPVIPGFADSDRPAWVQSVEDIADLCLEPVRLAHRDGQPLILMGSSVGAWVAVEIALSLFDLAPRLALAGPLGLSVPGHPPADHWFMTDDERDRTLYRDVSNKPQVSPEEFIANEAMAARVGWNPRFASQRLAPRLPRLRSPVLLLWGADDRLLPPAHREAWPRMLPQAETAVLEDCGHYPVHERPRESVAAVNEFVKHHALMAEGVSS